MNSRINLKSFVFVGFLVLVSLAFFTRHLTLVRAEQSGTSPESGATSRLQTLSAALVTLGYGSTAAGSWGDWLAPWNRIYSAATKPFNDAVAKGLKTGGGGANVSGCTSGLSCYPQSVGGVEDYNNNGTIPSDSYVATWTVCNVGNNYCGTGRSVAEKRDENTGLIWSPSLGSQSWFVANNCKYPNGLSGDDGVCNTNGEVACQCVKHTGGADAKTGCENYDDGNWHLPNQKELMQSYIDGSWAKQSSAGNYFWSSTTTSNNTIQAWFTNQSTGYTNNASKTNSYPVRCVR